MFYFEVVFLFFFINTLGFGLCGRPQNELGIPLLFPLVDEQPEEEQEPADLDDVFRRLDGLIGDHIRDEQVSPPVIDMLDLYTAEAMLVTEDEDEQSTDDELFAPNDDDEEMPEEFSSDDELSETFSPGTSDEDL